MAHAKQARRIARQWAKILGTAAGIEAVDDFAQGDIGEGRDADELTATITGRYASWDGPAIQAGAAQIDRCPTGYEHAYYEAYQAGAVARVHELTA